MKEIKVIDVPHTWPELTREQLIYIQSLDRGKLSLPQIRLDVFLYLIDMELCLESIYVQDKIQDADELSKLQNELNYIEGCLDGTGAMDIVLKSKDNDSYYHIKYEDLFVAIKEYTAFLDEPYNLLDNLLGDIEIEYSPDEHSDKRLLTLRCPSVMLTDITYEQFQNAQSALQFYWQSNDELSSYLEKIKDKDELDDLKVEQIQTLTNLSDKLNEHKCEFMSHLLILDEPSHNKKVLRSRNKLGFPKEKVVYEIEHNFKYSSSRAPELAAILRKAAPPYLFPILYQQFQSSLIAFKQKFPNLLGGKSNDGNNDKDQFVAMLNTVNTVMKEQGYTDQQSVFDTNAVFVFEAIDSMIKHSKDMEKINRKSRTKK